ncbi:MAG: S-methyl-5-thioribose-1-phosphate isomerase [Actinobacteria bacterium]|nr:S-methyl-5-thioribose-1-phosphate isomerase [Actinomycetota bacterium]
MTEVFSARLVGDAVELLDQTLLPDRVEIVTCRDDDTLAEAIASLRVRGAPAIGIAAAFGIAAAVVRAASSGAPVEPAARRAAATLRPVRPTAVNLAWACDRMLARLDELEPGSDVIAALREEAEVIASEDRDACAAMGANGADLLRELAGGPLRVLTHCNTGALCTAGIGTAFGVVRTLHERGELAHLWVDETRPLLQGARLTAWEAANLAVPHAVLVDAAAASVFRRGDVDAVVVGADRIAANGDVANKIGTYGLAVLAAHHDVPFVVVAPTSTIDTATPRGATIAVEERGADEVRAVRGAVVVAADSPAHNPAFDVTPAELVTAIVTERGVTRPSGSRSVAGVFHSP